MQDPLSWLPYPSPLAVSEEASGTPKSPSREAVLHVPQDERLVHLNGRDFLSVHQGLQPGHRSFVQ